MKKKSEPNLLKIRAGTYGVKVLVNRQGLKIGGILTLSFRGFPARARNGSLGLNSRPSATYERRVIVSLRLQQREALVAELVRSGQPIYAPSRHLGAA